MKIGKGKLITELVKGSIDYAVNLIRQAFYAQFPYGEEHDYSINEVFADHVIVSDWRSNELKSDEYWKVTLSKEGESFTFAAREAWEVVELTYQPQTAPSGLQSAVSEKAAPKKKGKRFEERVNAFITLEEAVEGKGRRIKIDGAITAGVVNGNKRRYPASVIESAVAELRGHLNESAGQGRAVQVLGEAEHPSDKGGRPNFLETVTKWEEVSFNGSSVDITGRILETSKGKDILTLMEGGVMPGVSLRGYGEGKNITERGEKIFEVSDLHITGFDLVLEPSFENSAELIESINQNGDDEMNLEELLKLLREHPEAFAGITEAQVKKMGAEQLKGLEDQVRSALGIGAGENIAEAVKANADKAKKFDELQAKSAVDAAITEATKDLPFGKELNEAFVESIKEAELGTPDAVKKFAESKRKEYGKLASKGALKGMGMKEGRITGVQSVLEAETGIPEFARASFEFQESLVKSENRKIVDVTKGESPAAIFTTKLLERFDKLYEKKLLQEAESASDLNLPYSVSRAIVAEAFPNLVAANIFDVGIMNTSDERIYYEAFAGETGYAVAITDEVETAGAEDTTYSLAHPRIVPGTVVVTSNPAGTTYVEGTDFVIDYELGTIRPIAAGSIGANDLLVDYTYNAIRQGEDAEIQRAKTTLSYQLVTAAADRLADYITNEAIVFSRANLGWDAVTRTMANLVRQMRLNIDRGLIEKALGAALGVASNSGGTYDISSDTLLSFVQKIGYAKVLVANRYYEPTGILMSQSNADILSNWDGFTRLGFPNAVLTAAGFAGGVKGLPIFASTQMRDSWVMVFNREIVQHRVFQPMTIKGPFQTFGSNRNLVAAEQYYAEEYNASIAPIGGKAATVTVQA